MAVTIKKAVLWRKELENRPGTLADALKPLAEAGVNLQVVMGYAFPGEPEHAAVEVFPITGGKAEQAASQAGLEASPRIACLLVTGDDSPGLGHGIADKLAANGINISFVMVQVSGRQYHGVFGFESQEEADRAISVIKEAAKSAAPKRAARKATGRGAATKAKAGRASGRKKAGGKAGARKTTAKKSAGKGTAKKTTARAGAKKTTARGAKKSTSRKTTARKATKRK